MSAIGRGLGTLLAAAAAAAVTAVSAHAAWQDGTRTTLLAAIAFWSVILLSRSLPMALTGSGSSGTRVEAERRRYRSAGLPRSLLVRIRCERRARFPWWLAAFVLAAVAAGESLADWLGQGVLGGAMLAGAVSVPVISVLLESRAWARAAKNEIRLEGTRLVASDASGTLGAIDLTEPFTYQVLARADAEAVYRLDQGTQRIEFTSSATEAPWVVYDVLKLEWPPRDRAVWDG